MQAAAVSADEVKALSERLAALISHAKANRLALVVQRSSYNKGKWTIQLKGRMNSLENESLLDALAGMEKKALGASKLPKATYDEKTIAELLPLVPVNAEGWFSFTADFRKRSGNVFHATLTFKNGNSWYAQTFKGASSDAAAALGECLGKAELL